MGIAGRNLTVIRAERYIEIELGLLPCFNNKPFLQLASQELKALLNLRKTIGMGVTDSGYAVILIWNV